jgi:uncharacterized protein YmfQ (DUF2313 family)
LQQAQHSKTERVTMASRKHYVSLARELGYALAVESGDGETAVTRCVEIIAEVLRQENPRFNKERFVEAVNESHAEWSARIDGVYA